MDRPNRQTIDLDKLDRKECIYLIQSKKKLDEETFLKIGHTGNARQRSNTHGSENPREIILHHVFGFGLHYVENCLKKKFSHLRIAPEATTVEVVNSGVTYTQSKSNEIYEYNEDIVKLFKSQEDLYQFQLESSAKKLYGKILKKLGTDMTKFYHESANPFFFHDRSNFNYEDYALVNFNVDLKNMEGSPTYGFVNLVENVDNALNSLVGDHQGQNFPIEDLVKYAKTREETGTPWYDTIPNEKLHCSKRLFSDLHKIITNERAFIRNDHDLHYYRLVCDLDYQFHKIESQGLI